MSGFGNCRNSLRKVPKRQAALSARYQKSKSIKDLNIDCLLHVCSFLDFNERLKLMLACESLEDISNELDLENLMSEFNIKETKRILLRIGPNIEKITYKLFSNALSFRDIDVIFQIKKNCQNIREINVSFQYYRNYLKIRPNNFELVKSLILSSKQIQVLKLKGCDLTDENCKVISTLTQLKSLNLKRNRRITGKHLNKLKNLSNLYLRECSAFETKHFVAICKSANMLETLDIRSCKLLEKDTIEALAETQTRLETVRLSLISGNHFERLSKQKNLKIFQMTGKSEDCLSLLAEAVRLKIELLETFALTLHLDNNEKLSKYRHQILRLKSIKTLHLNGSSNLADDIFLEQLAQNCTELEELSLSDAESITQRGVVYVVENLQNLKILDLKRCPNVNETLFQKIVAVMKAKKSIPIKIHVGHTEFEENFLENDAYKKAKDLVTLSFESVNFKRNYKKWIRLCGSDFWTITTD